MYAIETENLTKTYGKTRGITDVNMVVREGEIFGFIGPNGAGKSTTLRILLNLIFPTKGIAKIFGKDCVTDTKEVKKNIGYLPSEVNYYEDMSVHDLFNYSASFYKHESKERAKLLADRLELDLNKRFFELSLGNKKKAGIVQSLMHRPKLLIFDEPTSGLDPLIQSRFFDIIHEENKNGVTVFFSSHVLSEVQKVCDRVAIIKAGQLIAIEEVGKLQTQTFKKIKVELKNVPSDLSIAGAFKLLKEHNHISFLYEDNIKKLLPLLSPLDITNIWIEDPSLDEIFMHYYAEEGERQ